MVWSSYRRPKLQWAILAAGALAALARARASVETAARNGDADAQQALDNIVGAHAQRNTRAYVAARLRDASSCALMWRIHAGPLRALTCWM